MRERPPRPDESESGASDGSRSGTRRDRDTDPSHGPWEETADDAIQLYQQVRAVGALLALVTLLALLVYNAVTGQWETADRDIQVLVFVVGGLLSLDFFLDNRRAVACALAQLLAAYGGCRWYYDGPWDRQYPAGRHPSRDVPQPPQPSESDDAQSPSETPPERVPGGGSARETTPESSSET